MSWARTADEENLIQEEDERSDDERSTPQDTNRSLKTRHILAFLGFLGFANVYAMRVNLSVAIVAMSNNSDSNLTSKHSTFSIYSPLMHSPSLTLVEENGNGSHQHLDVCPGKPRANVQSIGILQDDDKRGEFPWDDDMKSLIVGSFFIGYVPTQIPGGRLSELFGGRHVFGLGVLLTGVFTLLSPVVARTYNMWGIGPFLVLRILEGLSEGVTFPAMMAMFSHWVPPLERSRITSFVYAGALFGTIISMPISGILSDLDLPVYWWLLGPGGWALAFYIFGALGVIWYIAWMIFVSDSPASHPNISSQERLYIEHSLMQPDKHHHRHGRHSSVSSNADDSSDNSSVPWCHIMMSLPVWAIMLTMVGQSWAFYTLLTELPTYMDQILHFKIIQDSFFSALPYLMNWICSLPFSWAADWLISKGYMSTTTSMKVFNSLAVVVPSLCFIGVAYGGCHSNFILILLAISGAFSAAGYSGVQVNHLALSPRFAGTLYGLTNAVSNTCGFLAPYTTGKIIYQHETITRWRYVFLLSAGINLFTNFIYIAFATGKVQPWNNLQVNTNVRDHSSAQHAFSEHSINENREEENS